MKVVNFDGTYIENFCNHIDPMELKFENNKLTMITGPNGIGKTAMFQSLPFALYGNCEKGRGSDVLNNKIGKNCKVIVPFSITENNVHTKYRVERYVKYTKLGDTVLLFKNDDEKPYKKGHMEVLPEIEKILVPQKLFQNTLLFSQKVKSFFTDLNDAEQKEIFRKILSLDNYVLYQKEAKKKEDEIKEKTTGLLAEIAIKKELIEDAILQISNITNEKERFESQKETDLEILRNGLLTLEDEVATTDSSYQVYIELKLSDQIVLCLKDLTIIEQSIKISIAGEKAEEAKIESARSLKESEFKIKATESRVKIVEWGQNSLDTERDKRSKFAKELEESISKAHKEEAVLITERTNISNEISKTVALNDQYQQMIDSGNTICTSCLQSLEDATQLKDEIKRLLTLEYDLKKIEETKSIRIDKLFDMISEFNSQLKINQENLVENLNEITEHTRVKTVELDKKLLDVITKLNDITNKKCEELMTSSQDKRTENNKRKEELESQRNDINTQLERQESTKLYLENTRSKLDNMKENTQIKTDDIFDESRIQYYVDRKINLTEEVKSLDIEISKQQKLLEITSFWKTGFSSSGIQSMLIDEAIPFMNSRASYYLDQLSGGRYTISFDTLKATKDNKEFRDKISVNVFDNITHADSRVKISGGQERIVDIATILSLCDLQSKVQNISFNVLLFDEIFDALDDENVTYVSKLLRQVAKDKSVFIISHRHVDLECDQILTFR